jgi:hypothetical protein
MSTPSTGSNYDYRPDRIPREPANAVSRDHESLLGSSSGGMSTRPRVFFINLFRPHVRDYESMNLVLDHLGTFCDNALLEICLNHNQNIGFTPDQMFQHTYARITTLWPLDERVDPDLREAVHKFDWRALWNATMEERLRIRHYQNDRETYGSCRRSGTQRWIIISAAYANLNEYAFGLDILRYLEPIATMQAYHSGFCFAVVENSISDENMHWFSRSFFRHWDQAFQLLEARHPDRNREHARHIFNAFVRQGVNVVDVFLKYWYQGSEDGSDDDFGISCERAGRSAVDRQWKVELDSPFPSAGADQMPSGIRTILARVDHIRCQETLFNTAAYLAGTIERENMHHELFKMILESVKDWAAATGNETVFEDLAEFIDSDKNALNNTNTGLAGREDSPRSSNQVQQSPLGNRPLQMPPIVLLYDLPDELPEPVEELDEHSNQPSEADRAEWEEYTLRSAHLGWIQRLIHRLHSLVAPMHVLPWDLELADIPLEACGPRIAPDTVSHACEAPQDEICVICLDGYGHETGISKNSTRGKRANPDDQAFRAHLRHRVTSMIRRQKAEKKEGSLQSMQLNSCSHVFHLSCLHELVNQAYPKAGVVQCPCCRTVMCRARPTRVARSRLGRLPIVGRLARY